MNKGKSTTAEAMTDDEDLDARTVLRALGPTTVLGGSVVLLKLLLALLVRALRAAANTPQADKPATTEEEGDGDAAPKPKPKTKAKAKETGFGDVLEGWGIAALCVAGAVGAGGTIGALLWSLLTPWHGYILGVLIVAWYLAAAAVGLERTRRQDDAGDGAEEPTEEDDDGEWEYYDDEDDTENDHGAVGERHSPAPAAITFPQAEEALMRHILTEVLAAVDAGRKGVHLSTLVQAMPPDWDAALLRMVLARYRLPVQKMQIRGLGNTWGIHIDALKRVLSRSPEECLATFADAPDPHLIKTAFWPDQVAARATAPTAPAAPVQTPAPAVAVARLAPPAPAAPVTPVTPSVQPPGVAPAETPAAGPVRPAMARILRLIKGPSPDRVA